MDDILGITSMPFNQQLHTNNPHALESYCMQLTVVF